MTAGSRTTISCTCTRPPREPAGGRRIEPTVSPRRSTVDTRCNPTPPRGDGDGDRAAHLRPVLARAAELGRGPSGLVRLLRVRGTGDEARARLAEELSRALARAGVTETLAESARPG